MNRSGVAAVAAASFLVLLLTLVARTSLAPTARISQSQRVQSLLEVQELPTSPAWNSYSRRLGSLHTHPRFARNKRVAILQPYSLAENPTWAPAGGYTKYREREDLPPVEWGNNFDGKNFHEPFHTQIPTKHFKVRSIICRCARCLQY